MKILLTLRQPLLPADTGGKVRSWNIFSRLAKRVAVHAVSFADPVADAGAILEMKAAFASYTPVFWREAKRYSLGFYQELMANQFSRLPYFLAKCHLPHYGSVVERLLRQEDFDLLFCDFLHTAVPLLECSFRPRLIFEHNVEFLLRKRKWQVEKHFLRRRVFGAEWKKTRPLEARVCRSFNHVLTVSEDDRQTIQREFGIDHVSAIPTGVDTNYFLPSENLGERPGRMVFVGSLDWDPNEDGIIWFLDSIYPRIRQTVPTSSFAIIGRDPSPRLRTVAAKSPGVEITGRVPDVRPYLAEAEVVVVPLRIGGGTRIKIPEAMAMGKPVVSTPIGAEGLPFQDRKHLCIAENSQNFAAVVAELLMNSSLRKAVGDSARNEVLAHHSWEAVVDQVEEILERAAGKKEQPFAGGSECLPAMMTP